jgi:membrane protein
MKPILINSYRFVRMFIRLWSHHQISLRAAALTYAMLLAFIPILAVALSGGSLFIKARDLNTMLMPYLVQHLAPGSAVKVGQLINNLLGKVHFKAMGYVGFGALLITSLLLLSSIENSINRIWSIRKKKDLWKRVVIYNLLLVLGPASISASLATLTWISHLFPAYVARANLGAMLINGVLLTFVYKIFPNKKVSWIAAFVAGVAAAGAIDLAKWGYAIYTTKALFYNEVYGGLAVVPLFLIWIYVNWNIFLGGALLTYMIQHRQSYRFDPEPNRQKKKKGEPA